MSKILIIDDSESCRTELKDALQSYEIIEAKDGIDGLNILAANPEVDLIICDVNMPKLDGVGFCKKKSENKIYDSIPILMVTTESNTELKKELKAFSVKAWMLKPINPENLIRGVQMLIDQRKKAA
jgi:two-component system chemotaxis response regulator CheY